MQRFGIHKSHIQRSVGTRSRCPFRQRSGVLGLSRSERKSGLYIQPHCSQGYLPVHFLLYFRSFLKFTDLLPKE